MGTFEIISSIIVVSALLFVMIYAAIGDREEEMA